MSHAFRSRLLLGGLLTLLAAILFAGAWLASSYSSSKSRVQIQQRAAADAVSRLGGTGSFAHSSLSLRSKILERNDAPNLFFLNSKNLVNDDLKLFESAPATRAIHLFGNQLTDEGLVHLKDLPALEYLDLRRNAISDDGLVHLEKLDHLQQLWLLGTNVTPEGVKRLRKKLPNTKIEY